MSVSMLSLEPANLRACYNLSISDEQHRIADIEAIPALLDKLLADQAIQHRVFCVDGEVIGYAAYLHEQGTTWYDIQYFLIDQYHQRQGLGTLAFQQLLTDLMTNPDCKVIKLKYRELNHTARRLYQKFGFVDIHAESGSIIAVRISAYKAEVSTSAEGQETGVSPPSVEQVDIIIA